MKLLNNKKVIKYFKARNGSSCLSSRHTEDWGRWIAGISKLTWTRCCCKCGNPLKCPTLCDCIGHMPMSPTLLYSWMTSPWKPLCGQMAVVIAVWWPEGKARAHPRVLSSDTSIPAVGAFCVKQESRMVMESTAKLGLTSRLTLASRTQSNYVVT